MKDIQQLRRIAVQLGVSGTVTPLAETWLYKGGYGFVILQAYVPVTQNRSNTSPLCTVFRTTIDKFGNRKQFNNDVYNMLYTTEAEIENAKYMVFECPLPKAFTDTAGELEMVFTYSEINSESKAAVRLTSGIYRTSVKDSDVSDGETVDPVGGELARLNDLTTKIEQLEDCIEQVDNNVNALLQQPDCSNANKVGTPTVTIAADGRLKFSELKGYDALMCSLILKSQEQPEYYRDHTVNIAISNFSRTPIVGDVFIMSFEQIDTAAFIGSWRISSMTEDSAICELVDFVNVTEPIKDYADSLNELVAMESERAKEAERELGDKVSENASEIQSLREDVNNIDSFIPTTTSEANQLADKAFVNSSINNLAAFYITSNVRGDAFPTKTSLLNASAYYFAGQTRTPTKNDYAIVLEDESQPKSVDGKYPTTRYMYDGKQWDFQYIVNNTALTQAQIDAINSGITESLVSQIESNAADLSAEQTTRESADTNLQNQINEFVASGVTSVNGNTGDVSVTPENIGAVDKSGDTINGKLVVSATGEARAEVDVVTPSDKPCDFYIGANGKKMFSLSARGSQDPNTFLFYDAEKSDFPVHIFRSDGSIRFEREVYEKGQRVFSDNNLPTAVSGTYSGNGGQQTPNSIGKNKVKFYMANGFPGITLSHASGHMDIMQMNCYSWSDVPYATAFAVCKKQNRAWIVYGGNKDVWDSAAELVTSHNVSEYVSNAKLDSEGVVYGKTNNLETYYGEDINVMSQAGHTVLHSTIIGRGCSLSAISSNVENAIVIGNGANVSNKSNIVQMGNSSISTANIQVSWKITSDERDKTDIEPIDEVKALDFITQLDPIQYVDNDRQKYLLRETKTIEHEDGTITEEYDEDGVNEKTYRQYGMCEYDREAHAHGDKKGERKRVGLRAQQVQSRLIEIFGSDNYANIVDDNFHDLKEAGNEPPVENKLTMSYEQLVPFLIGAIKEQQKQIQELQYRISGGKNEI